MTITCHNCGLPSDAVNREGRSIVLRLKPQNSFCRPTRRRVWCCSDECTYQALAVAAYGPAVSKWPITLAEFRALNPLPPKPCSDHTETIAETRINSGSTKAENGFIDPNHREIVSVRKTGLK